MLGLTSSVRLQLSEGERARTPTEIQVRPLLTIVLIDLVQKEPSAFLTERVRLTVFLRSLARTAGTMSGE